MCHKPLHDAINFFLNNSITICFILALWPHFQAFGWSVWPTCVLYHRWGTVIYFESWFSCLFLLPAHTNLSNVISNHDDGIGSTTISVITMSFCLLWTAAKQMSFSVVNVIFLNWIFTVHVIQPDENYKQGKSRGCSGSCFVFFFFKFVFSLCVKTGLIDFPEKWV